MSIFKKKKVDPIDDRTDIERKFEHTGQKVGKKTGELAQKGMNKINDFKDRLDEQGKLDKLKEIGDKIEEKTDKIVKKVTEKGKEVVGKVKKNKDL